MEINYTNERKLADSSGGIFLYSDKLDEIINEISERWIEIDHDSIAEGLVDLYKAHPKIPCAVRICLGVTDNKHRGIKFVSSSKENLEKVIKEFSSSQLPFNEQAICE